MQVRLSASWTDPGGTLSGLPGDTIDVDAVTLAELEEQGMVEEPEGQSGGVGGDHDHLVEHVHGW